MAVSLGAIIAGLVLLVWSAGRFVGGAGAAARHLGMSPLLIGMIIVGFGTSAPEMSVSVLAALQGNPGIALGNAYGSNIANIALILGLTALLSPIAVQSTVVRKELPMLLAVTALAASQLWDGAISRLEALALLGVFAALMIWTIAQGARQRQDNLGREMDSALESSEQSLSGALMWLTIGLVLLIASSRLLVWGAVSIAQGFGVSDLIIGLTVVAVGTSLPELASSLTAIKKNEHDIALGNVLGSNLFNTLAVVGIAGSIHPMSVGPEVLTRDISVLTVLTLSLVVFGYRVRGPGRINRWEGGALLCVFFVYSAYLIVTAV